MKRCWFGVGLLAALLALSILTAGIMERWHSRIADMLEQASQAMAAEDWQRAEALSAHAGDLWHRGAAFSAAMLDHEPMEEIESLLAQTKLWMEKRDGENGAQVCLEAAVRVGNIARTHRFTWWNLL